MLQNCKGPLGSYRYLLEVKLGRVEPRIEGPFSTIGLRDGGYVGEGPMGNAKNHSLPVASREQQTSCMHACS